jgi:hypothetical protein
MIFLTYHILDPYLDETQPLRGTKQRKQSRRNTSNIYVDTGYAEMNTIYVVEKQEGIAML